MYAALTLTSWNVSLYLTIFYLLVSLRALGCLTYKAGALEMSVFLRVKALKTENVNIFLCANFACAVISFRMITGCTFDDRNFMCYIHSSLRILFLYHAHNPNGHLYRHFR